MSLWTYLALAAGIIVLLNVVFVFLLVIAVGRRESDREEWGSDEWSADV